MTTATEYKKSLRYRCKGIYFMTISQAIERAKFEVKYIKSKYNTVVSVWDTENNTVVAVITDDANGVTVHKLVK